jgi:hypothetical protein
VIAAYADPPYIGQAKRHYADDPQCAEVDHAALIDNMCSRFDCWALSCSSPSLKEILEMCPPEVRIGAWVKPFAIFKPNVNPGYAWEPVILWHGRQLGRDVKTVRDWVSENVTLKKGVSGAKPPGGTGIVTECWQDWQQRKSGEPIKVPLFEVSQ